MMRGGECWELSTPALLTNGNESGSWPTPLASNAKGVDYQYDQGDHSKPRLTLCGMAKLWPTPHGFSPDGRTNGPSGNELGRAVNQSLWQTPVADDAVNRTKGKVNSRGEPKLSAQVLTCPTPRSRDWKDTGTVPPSRMEDPGKDSLGQWLARTEPGGSLNPTWVEWLMGWPLGWTDSALSATDRFRQWLRSHGSF
jgi:hypothetical protein